jgi:hypothetical protein
MSFSGSLIFSLVLPAGAEAGVSIVSGLESSLGAVIVAALGLGVGAGGEASGDLSSSTPGAFTSSTGTWTGVEGMARIISDAAEMVAMWSNTEAAMQEYKIRSSI